MNIVTKLNEMYPDDKNLIFRIISLCKKNRDITFSQLVDQLEEFDSEQSLNSARKIFIIFRWIMFKERTYSKEMLVEKYPEISQLIESHIAKITIFVNMFVLILVEFPDTKLDFKSRMTLVSEVFAFKNAEEVIGNFFIGKICLHELDFDHKTRDLDGFDFPDCI